MASNEAAVQEAGNLVVRISGRSHMAAANTANSAIGGTRSASKEESVCELDWKVMCSRLKLEVT
ncbi:putative transcriptional regulators [Comamonas testosteroni TK102]|uniref:Putative transcriptional regulators n=1 Tax=Comamonas testosteroni TK102 TaxID=1392005 RepID=A0A076PK22_COMTE|nr:putative transcriptional regulators [Comamonas testosteroni TK102]